MSLINFTALEASGLKMPSHPLGRSVVHHWLKIDRMNALYESHLQGLAGAAFVEALLSQLEIRVEVSDDDLRHLPAQGPFIMVSNHPFGFLDGVVMLHLMRRHPDFKVMANFFLGEFAPIRDRFIAVNPFSGQHPMNVQGMRRALSHVEGGGALGIFPAGEVATVQRGLGRAEDKAWHRSMVRLICKAGVPVVPIRFSGGNSAWFHLVGKIHPYLRTLSIPSELFKKRGATIGLRIGKAVSADVLRQTGGVEEAGAYLRACVNALEPARVNHDMWLPSVMKRVQPVVDAVDPQLLCGEVEALRERGNVVLSKGGYEVFLATRGLMPAVMREIGRLREVTFRQVGEGTNRSIDLDGFDAYYHHLFLWHAESRSIAGAYRIGAGDEMVARRRGFYVQTLFDLDDAMMPLLRQTLELGRSFVVKAHQQKPLPLFLLWQGILCFLQTHRQYRYLMGPVSISNDLSAFSRDLIAAYVRKYHFDERLARWVRPRRALVMRSQASDIEAVLARHANDLAGLDRFIAGIEPRGLKVPVMLKQYIRQNARIVGFNVDAAFNDSLDGLMVLDVRDLPAGTYDFLGGR